MTSTFPNGLSLGRYRIVKLLGRGVSGNVYLARDTMLEVDVALKAFVSEAVDSAESWERFKREIIVARKLSHPGICRVFDLHEEVDVRFLTMELVEGKNLEDVLTDTVPPTAERMVAIVVALLDALAVAHNSGITHRDLKPTNIVVDARGQPVILDFGFAKGRGSKDVTQAGAVVGTPAYMAPEQFSGVAASPLTDLWSVAVILYRGLAGRPPFQGDNLLAIGDAVLNTAPEAPADVSFTVSRPLSDVVMRALAKSPEDRFPTAEIFAAALQPFVVSASRPVAMATDAPEVPPLLVPVPSSVSAPYLLQTPAAVPPEEPPAPPVLVPAPVEPPAVESQAAGPPTTESLVVESPTSESPLVEPPATESPAAEASTADDVAEAEVLEPIEEGAPPPAEPEAEPPPAGATVPNPVVSAADGPTQYDVPTTSERNSVFDSAALETSSDRIEKTVVQMIGQTTFSQVIRSNIAPTTILFSDIVGITSYFDQHGDIRGRKLLETHNNLLFPVIDKCGGTVVKTIGDAIMASFPTGDQGVAAAVGMQRALKLHNAGAADDDQIEIRIGVHSGHAIIEKQDVFGNTVNVAARITARAEGGQILISAATRGALTDESNAIAFHTTAELKGKEDAFNLYKVQWREETEPQIQPEEAGPRAEPTEVIAARAVQGNRGPNGQVSEGTRPNAENPLLGRRWLFVGAALLGCLLAVVMALVVARGRLSALGLNFGPSSRLTINGDGSPASTVTELTVVPDPPDAAPGPGAKEPDAGSPTPEPTPGREPSTSPSPPVSPKPASAVSSEDRAAAARKKAALYVQLSKHDETLRTRGIIDGDNVELDTTHRKIDKLMKQGRYDDAATAIKHADQVALAVNVDKAFVSAKLVRFNKQFDRVRSKSLRKKLEPTGQMVLNALSAGDNAAANKHLNRGFAMLKGGG